MNNPNADSILIVDDNSKNLQVLADILRNRNYRVALAKDGFKALKFIDKRKPDLILLDVMMPEIDGFETCRRLSADPRTEDIPIIFISALTDTLDKVKGFEAGGVDYITKPFQKEEVLARVKTHLELKRSREELKIAYEKLQKAYEELETAAKTDSLTRLSNRRDIIEKMKYEITKSDRNSQPFAIILSDIDDFKQINDEYGHDCGDYVLVRVSEIIRMKIRRQDTVARWGGEEFLFLLPETNLKGGLVVAEMIKETIAQNRFEYDGHVLKVTMTYGISEFIRNEDIDNCIKKADEALYRGKNSGKNCVVASEG